jgi:hypothetical protein
VRAGRCWAAAALWDDLPGWLASHGIPQPTAAFATSRTVTVEEGLPEMRGRKDFYLLVASELSSAGMLTASLTGRRTTDVGRQFVRFITPPGSPDAVPLTRSGQRWAA